jgi:hypothetical protein
MSAKTGLDALLRPEDSVVVLIDHVAEHGGGSGVAFAWEMQLLAGRVGV